MSFDPWTALAAPPAAKQSRLDLMRSLGLHVMKKEWAEAGIGTGRVFSTSLRQATLKIHGTSEEMTIPVQTCTTVSDVKHMLADRLMISPDELTFTYKQGCGWRVHKNMEQISSKVTVKGIPSFKPLAYCWPHPIGVLGAGYNGVKTGIKWLRDGNPNFVVFDRNKQVGGYCWITAANKHSKLQTEFASFHVWFGPEFGADKRCGGIPTPETWEIWPGKERVLWHMQHAAEEYGVLPHCRFSTNVDSMEIFGRKTDHTRFYELSMTNIESEESYKMRCCGLINFPGVMTKNRLVEYPGEETFGGQIGYGMNDDIPYEHLQGSHTAILGNGAFAIENVRTCCEYAVRKVFLITRRKNLASPRLSCWFVHQAAIPVPAALLLRTFEPMYELAGFGDPFSFWSVRGSRTTAAVRISSNSRFGIGDVTFLAMAYGILEFVEDTVKRFGLHSVHLTTGGKLKGVTNVIKALGLVGDRAVDKLHRMKTLVGTWCDGDYRRPIHIDSPGMDASNFETMSAGLGAYHVIHHHKFFFDYPKEYHRAADMGLLEMLPTNVATEDRPCYVYDVRYAMLAAPLTVAMCPKLAQLTPGLPQYQNASMHKAHPLKFYLQVCQDEWYGYQKAWQERGFKRETVPYPYTEDMVEAWIKEHSGAVSLRTVDDSVIPTMSAEEQHANSMAAYEWWMGQSGEARAAWGGKKAAMKSARSASAG